MTVDQIKQRFGIIGHSEQLNRAIDIAAQVAPTDLSVLITGESGSGNKAVEPYRKEQLIQSYLDMKKARLPEHMILEKDTLRLLMEEQSFWTKSRSSP